MTKHSSLNHMAPLSVVRGEQISATYTEQQIPEFKKNPLIEALPTIWTMPEVEEMLSFFPHYDPNQRNLPDEIRLHLLENTREFFIPHGIHYEIHLSISNMVRRGYIDRNPASRGFWPSRAEKLQKLKTRLQRGAFLRSKARGFCIVGVGGVGKSSAVENILSLYPQVITHTNYQEQDLILKQLVWVKLQCPSDGSLKSLCLNYIQEVDDILGTNYIKSYGATHRTLDALLPIMALVASSHSQGLLVFDEIQDLSEAKGGGDVRMLNFFVQLENTLGIPFVLIGTPKAKELLSGEFRQARRVSEQGDIYWRPMRAIAEKEKSTDPDEVHQDWNVFIRAMWRYWYLRKSHPLPANLLEEPVIKTLYDESKGITALIVTIFYLAQRRAITSGKEDLTAGVIRSVVRDNQYLVNEIFERIKSGQGGVGTTKPVSDLDSSSWRGPSEAQQNNDNKRPSAIDVGNNSERQTPLSARKESMVPVKSRKGPKSSKISQELEAGDLRALAAQIGETKAGERQLNDNDYFASADDFS